VNTGLFVLLILAAVVVALLIWAAITLLLVGPMARARRKRAEVGPTPDTDGEPDHVF
jgi:hypothetical protein